MSVYLSFIFTATLLALTPGPDVLLVVAIAAKEGFNKALQLTLGLANGVVFHTLLIVLGISALIQATPWAMQAIALFGAGYLLYLAWLTWQHRSEQATAADQPKIQGSYYGRGVIMNISNPKVLLFFLALFPQFAQLGEPGYALRIVILGLLFMLVTVVVFGGLAWLTAKSTQNVMQKPGFKITMDYLTVGIFVLLAGLLLYSVFQWVHG
ncbi:LysE family translocator [Marinicella meishanensis]|uniref:LysE family translocator n=1 Tax=Marinicella meishanensis TaxID=2873263 RepID=UPI001CBC088A|nr:LysE family translocator [Marinicella sp. NBU2979]